MWYVRAIDDSKCHSFWGLDGCRLNRLKCFLQNARHSTRQTLTLLPILLIRSELKLTYEIISECFFSISRFYGGSRRDACVTRVREGTNRLRRRRQLRGERQLDKWRQWRFWPRTLGDRD